MGRIVKDPDVRRNEILDAAQRLFYRKGYELTSVQEIILEIGIAKGTFYHYFSSKLDLLDATIERMVEQTLQALRPLVDDPQLSALEKFERFYSDFVDWKVENRAFFLNMIDVWYRDENAIFRDKVKRASIEMTVPFLAQIIAQGIDEGVFAVEYPADTAELVLQIGQPFSDTLVKIVVSDSKPADTLAIIERKRLVYHQAIERILNAPAGSLRLFDLEQIRPWLE
ncbi:MAG: TetR/AcrR family transcriptional regulator [Anaerolineae bacterium]